MTELLETQVRSLLDLGGEEEVIAPKTAAQWEQLIGYTQVQGVAPLLHVALRERSDVPAGVRSRLQTEYLVTAQKNLLLFHELELAKAALAASGIQHLLLKGAALAPVLYSSLALRPMLDLDLLVRKADVLRALAVLGDLGYVSRDPEARPDLALGFENELLLWRIDAGGVRVPLELHWHLFDVTYYQEQVSLDWFWQTAQPISANNMAGSEVVSTGQAMMLGPAGQLLHLCAHLALHHQGVGLIWLIDIARWLQQFAVAIEWPVVLAQAKAFGLVLPLQRILPRVLNWGGAIPADVLQALLAMQPTREEERLYAALNAPVRPTVQRFFTDLSGLAGWRRRRRYALAHIFPDRAYMRRRYEITHEALLPLYYPYRWVRGVQGALAARVARNRQN